MHGYGFYTTSPSFPIPRRAEAPGGASPRLTGSRCSPTLSNDANGNAFNQGPITFFAEPRDAHRFPTLRTMDFRVAKFFTVGRQRLEVIGDFFNLFNVSTVTGVNPNSGTDFTQPTDILGPRVFRIGGRWTF